MKKVRIHPCSRLEGEILVPGDKSISHRAVMFSALSDGVSKLKGLLLGEDVLSTIECFRRLGVTIDIQGPEVIVQGVGLKGLRAPAKILDCGNSGTTMRLMMGILSAQPFVSRLTGDASLNRRPMERVAAPLRQMGAQIEELRSSETERILRIDGQPLRGIHYRLPMASAQVKSAILLAGLFASGETQVEEPMPSRDHTELLLLHKGAALQREGTTWKISATNRLNAGDIEIPGDISSAAFFMVAALIAKEGKILLQSVGINPTRTGIIEVLQKMGGKISLQNQREVGGEAIADLEVQSSSLKAGLIGGDLIPRLIDEIPILSIAAAKAEGNTKIQDAQELRVKETDRIQSIAQELAKLAVPVKTFEDGLEIQGPHAFQAGKFKSYGDHRMAMSMAIAATQASGPCEIEDVECVETSYPGFFEHLTQLGVQVERF